MEEEKLKIFEKREFKNWVKDIFIKSQEAWTKNNPEDLIYIESRILYEKDAEKMKRYALENKREVRKDIVVRAVNVKSHQKEGENEILIIAIKTSMERYIEDLGTKEILEGIIEYQIDEEYEIILRKKGAKKAEIKCTYCGAKMNINALGKCEYCGNYTYSNEHDWVIEDIKKIKK